MAFFRYDLQNTASGLYDFTWDTTVLSSQTQITLNSQFSKYRFDMIILNLIECSDPAYPIIFINRTNWKF